MCNGHSLRVAQGGSIAVLRPTSNLMRSQSEEDMLLLFSNQVSNSGTSVELQGWGEDVAQDRHWVVIQ